jgi:hypothetical protein
VLCSNGSLVIAVKPKAKFSSLRSDYDVILYSTKSAPKLEYFLHITLQISGPYVE